MFTRFYPPLPALRGLVQALIVSHVALPDSGPMQICPYPPAAEQTLFFYPRMPMGRYRHRTGQTDMLPASLIVGPQVSRVDLTMGYDHLVVAVFFAPGGLHRLLRLPMHELLDATIDATLIWGRTLQELNEQLGETTDYDRMHGLVEAFLLRQFDRRSLDPHPIDRAFQQMLDVRHPRSLDYLADQACLSPRQFERKCHERLGLGPKTFSRIVRFSRAFRLKEHNPAIDWLDVALRCGYYDFRHMLRDFSTFAGTTPTRLLADETQTIARPYTSARF